MATTRYVHRDGSPVTPGHCVVPDNYVTTFVIQVRSTSPLSGAELKRLVQERHEVIGTVAVTESLCVVRN